MRQRVSRQLVEEGFGENLVRPGERRLTLGGNIEDIFFFGSSNLAAIIGPKTSLVLFLSSCLVLS